jgi:acyl carrier protein
MKRAIICAVLAQALADNDTATQKILASINLITLLKWDSLIEHMDELRTTFGIEIDPTKDMNVILTLPGAHLRASECHGCKKITMLTDMDPKHPRRANRTKDEIVMVNYPICKWCAREILDNPDSDMAKNITRLRSVNKK